MITAFAVFRLPSASAPVMFALVAFNVSAYQLPTLPVVAVILASPLR